MTAIPYGFRPAKTLGTRPSLSIALVFAMVAITAAIGEPF